MTKLVAIFGVLGMCGDDNSLMSYKVGVEIDPGALYESPEKTIRKAEEVAIADFTVVVASYHEGNVEQE